MTNNESNTGDVAAGVEDPDRLYTPQPGEAQLTLRAIVVGVLVGGMVTAMNIYIGLKIGWTFGGSITAAILGYAFFKVAYPAKPLTVLETNITQTAGSAAGYVASAGGLVSAIPAMKLLGLEVPPAALFFWIVSIAFLGVMFAVPLRRQYVLIDRLRFPTGTACANTIMAIFSEASEALVKARVLIRFGVFAFVYIVIAYFVPWLENPPLHEWIEVGALATMAAWGFKLYLGPALFGGGFLIGPRVGFSLAIGAVLSWGVLGPWSQDMGWAPHENPMKLFDSDAGLWGARGWILWPGVAIMVGDAVMSLCLSWRTFIAAFKGTTQAMTNLSIGTAASEEIPNSWWTSGLALAACSTIIIAYIIFDIPWYLSLLAVVLSALLASVAVRSVGETDINPVGGMGKVTQMVFGSVSDSMSTNLMSAGITSAGASQAGDMMQDLKVGYMLGASPKRQLVAQLSGILGGVVFAVPIYLLYDTAYEIGSDKLTAPAAMAWKAVAEVMSQGFQALPEKAPMMILVGLIVGAMIPVTRKLLPRIADYVPSGMAMGIAFIVQPYYSLVMFYGVLVCMLWRALRPQQAERLVFVAASGLLAGEGIAGLVNAVMTIAGVPSLVG